MHDCSVKVPMIIYDPRSPADVTRGSTCDALVEAIDLAPTFVEAAGGEPQMNWLEGRSLKPWLHGEIPEWREAAISEYNYSATPMAPNLNLANPDARMMMVFDGRWKLIHFEGGLRPMLFDLENDPEEFEDLGESGAHSEILVQMLEHLNTWGRRIAARYSV